jgi:hypothetical protein
LTLCFLRICLNFVWFSVWVFKPSWLGRKWIWCWAVTYRVSVWVTRGCFLFFDSFHLFFWSLFGSMLALRCLVVGSDLDAKKPYQQQQKWGRRIRSFHIPLGFFSCHYRFVRVFCLLSSSWWLTFPICWCPCWNGRIMDGASPESRISSHFSVFFLVFSFSLMWMDRVWIFSFYWSF